MRFAQRAAHSIGIIGLASLLVAEETKPTLKIGDAAPPLAPSRWLQGEPVKSMQTGTVYIVEFWATWCGPCRASIPHLNEIHNKLKDKGVVVIGQNVWERKPAEDVIKFVKEMGDKMTYRVTFDGENKMAKTWMEAADQGGVPTAFLVDKAGKIAWIGHPMDGLDKAAEEVLAGTFSADKEAKRKEQQQEAMKKLQTQAQRMGAAMEAEKWDDALALLAGMQKDAPEEMLTGLTVLEFNLHVKKKDGKAAAAVVRRLTAGKPDNAQLLNMLAWELATAEGLENRDLALAESLAVRANKASDEKEAGILDTLARITFMQGNAKQAIALQKKAVECAQEKALKDELAKTLKSYEDGKLPPSRNPSQRAKTRSSEMPEAPRPLSLRFQRLPAAAWLAAILVLTIAVYLPALRNGFTNADDPAYVVDNPLIRDLSLDTTRQIFTRFYEGYHPLTLLSFAVEYRWAGLNPALYHATNIALHLLNVVLVAALVRRLTASVALSCLVAALFAVHPVHVESVAWIAERKNVLYAAFYLSGLLAYLEYAQRGGRRAYALALALALLAALSNGKAIVFVLSIAAIDLLLARRLTDWQLWLEKLPFGVMALAFGILNLFSQRDAGYVYSIVDFTRFEHFLTGCRNLLMYAVKLLAPVRLVHQYPYPERVGAGLPLSFYAAPILLLAILLFFVAGARRSRLALFCALFYLANLALVAKFLPFGGVMMEDHFAYMPSLGIFLLLGLAVRGALARGRTPAFRRLAPALLGLWVLGLAGAAHARTRVWKDGVTLWSDVLAQYPHSPRGWLNRGAARGAAGDLAGAVADYRVAMTVMPDNAPIHFNLGNILLQGSRHEEAAQEYNTALRLDPSFAPAYFYRGVAHEQEGRIDLAIADYDRAIALGYFSHLTHPRFRRAVLLTRMERMQEALADFDDTLKAVQSADALYYRSYVLDRLGRHTEAAADYAEATSLTADCPPELVLYFATNAASRAIAAPR